MDSGEPNNETSRALSIKDQFSTLSVDADEESSVRDSNAEKDPREKVATNSTSEAESRLERYERIVPCVFKESWMESESPVCLNFYFVKFIPRPVDRLYKEFGLFLKASLPREAEGMKVVLNLHGGGGRTVEAELVPSGLTIFYKDEIEEAQKFHQMCLKAILDRKEFISEFVSLENNNLSDSSSSTFYLLLPIILHESNRKVDWGVIRRCLSSPIFRTPDDARYHATPHSNNHLKLDNGPKSIEDVVNSFVYAPRREAFYFVCEVVGEKKSHLSYPDQPLLKAKQLSRLKNLLCKRGNPESRKKEEHFINLPPGICQLKIIGFSKDIGSSLSLLPSIMHRLESLLVAIELKQVLSSSFPEGAEVSAYRVLEALTTEKCNEGFSYERLEVLGDAFLKFAVSRHLFLLDSSLAEGQLTQKRRDIVENSNLFKLATTSNLQVYIRDQSFDPCKSGVRNTANAEVRCNKNYHWLHKDTIADVVEALVGAFIVDSGFKAATAFLKWFGIQADFKELQVINICFESKKFLQFDAMIRSIVDLENLSGYEFLNKGLLLEAFVHPSCRDQVGGCFQRLEHLGDAVLDYLVTSYLYSVYAELNPGQFTALRSEFVKNKFLADVAVQHSIHEKLICSSSDLKESINKYINLPAAEKGLVKSPKVLADLVESFIGAILLDTGFDLKRVWKIMLSFLNPDMILSRLQAQGYKLEPKSLEKVLKFSCKMEAKLIGYDETPIDVTELNSMKLQEPSTSDYNPINKELTRISAPQSSEAPAVCQTTCIMENNRCSSGSQHAGGSYKGSAESHLYKICSDNCWKPPLFECYEEIGPNNLNEAVVKIEKASDFILECNGEPRVKREEAMEHAAEGALWYIKHEGTSLGKERSI